MEVCAENRHHALTAPVRLVKVTFLGLAGMTIMVCTAMRADGQMTSKDGPGQGATHRVVVARERLVERPRVFTNERGDDNAELNVRELLTDAATGCGRQLHCFKRPAPRARTHRCRPAPKGRSRSEEISDYLDSREQPLQALDSQADFPPFEILPQP